MADRIKPTNFPLKAVLDGLEELYTQTDGNNAKFLVDQIVQRANSVGLVPLVYVFTNVDTYSANHNLGRQPIIEVKIPDGSGYEVKIDVDIKSDNTSFVISSTENISGKIYVF